LFFVKEESKKILYFKKFYKYCVWLLHRSEISKRVFLEFEKEVEVHFVPMMTIFLSSIGETPQTLGIDMGWFLLLQPSFLG
jgi:hypothetical protein